MLSHPEEPPSAGQHQRVALCCGRWSRRNWWMFRTFDPDAKRYIRDVKVLTLARQWLRRNRFADLAQPLLDRLSQTHGPEAFLAKIGERGLQCPML